MATLDLTGTAHTYEFRLNRGDQPRFWPRWAGLKRGLFVLATYDGGWTITTHPGTKSLEVDDQVAAGHWWRGGQSHTFTDENGLAAALTSAGYTVS